MHFENKFEIMLQWYFITPPSGRGLVIPIFFRVFFFGWSLAPDLLFSLRQRNTRRVFRYTARGPILSDRNILYTPRGGRTTAGSNAPGAFLVLFLSRDHVLTMLHLAPIFAKVNNFFGRKLAFFLGGGGKLLPPQIP